VQRGQAPDVPPTTAAAAPREAGQPHKSSPVVRKIAAEHQIDVGQITGTGISGRVTKQDIVGYMDAGKGDGVTPPAPAAKAAGVAPSLPQTQVFGGSNQAGFGEIPEAYRPRALENDRIEDLTPMRQKIAEHMVISKRISPHVATVWEMDFTHVGKLRGRHKATWQERYGVNLTYTAFIMKVTVDALKAFPMLNASTDGKKVIYHASVNLGLAVALDWGLLVPVIHGADELNLLGIARRAADLAARARTKKLKPDEVQGGTFTITNPGSYGPMFNVPIINQPQVGMLGVGTVEKRPVVIDDMLGIRTRAYLSMSFDHRLVDGVVADQFMGRIKKGIEEFDEDEL
jgi:pyruvate dehydrogenase E2 component (dihydrolipoamide acetyltransferase)